MLFPVAAWAKSCYEGCPANFQVLNEDLELKTPRSQLVLLSSSPREKQILRVFMKIIYSTKHLLTGA